MRYLFIGVFIIALIAAVVGWYTNRPATEGWLGRALSVTGVKERENSYREQMRIAARETLQRQRNIFEDIKDQRVFIENNNDRIRSLSQITQQATNRSKDDALRMQALMENLQDQNRLLVEHSNELVRMNQEQLKLRQEVLSYANSDNTDIKVNQQHLNEVSQQMLTLRTHHINESQNQARIIQDKMKSFNEHLKGFDTHAMVTNDDYLKEKIKEMSARSDEIMDLVKLQQQRLREKSEQNEFDNKQIKERLVDFIAAKSQQFDEQKIQLSDHRRVLDERAATQLEQLRQQRENNKYHSNK